MDDKTKELILNKKSHINTAAAKIHYPNITTHTSEHPSPPY